jgi:dimethylargininase
MDIAVTRGVSPGLADCELTFLERAPIDVARAEEQHRAYEGLLEVRLPADSTLPDCCFVEDAALVFDEVAVVTRPGAPSRRRETEVVASALAAYRPIVPMRAPARLDGGDVLVVGRQVFVGLSARTDAEGLAALDRALRPFGYDVAPVGVRGCLHLKSAATALGEDALLVNPEWIDLAPLRAYECVPVDPAEPWAANVLRVRDVVVAASGFPRTRDRLRARGLGVREVDMSEFLKAEAGVTCKSLVFRRGGVNLPRP